MLLLPWIRIRAAFSHTLIDEQYLYSDGTFDYRSGVFAEVVARGTDLWQGIGTTIVCLAVMMVIMLSALVHRRGYRIGLMMAGGLIIYLAIGVMFDPSFPMNSRVQFAAEPDALTKERRERQGALSDVAFVEREAQDRRVTLHRQMLPGVPAVMALGALLIAAGIAETVQARGVVSKAAASDVAPSGVRQTLAVTAGTTADEPPRLALLLMCGGGLVVGGAGDHGGFCGWGIGLLPGGAGYSRILGMDRSRHWLHRGGRRVGGRYVEHVSAARWRQGFIARTKLVVA